MYLFNVYYFYFKTNVDYVGMTLIEFLTKYPYKQLRAETGGNSHSRRILGLVGEDKKVNVPTGITVYDDKNNLIGKRYNNYFLLVYL